MEKLLENLNISQENLMALGDGENDIGMLKVTPFIVLVTTKLSSLNFPSG